MGNKRENFLLDGTNGNTVMENHVVKLVPLYESHCKQIDSLTLDSSVAIEHSTKGHSDSASGAAANTINVLLYNKKC